MTKYFIFNKENGHLCRTMGFEKDMTQSEVFSAAFPFGGPSESDVVIYGPLTPGEEEQTAIESDKGFVPFWDGGLAWLARKDWMIGGGMK